MTVNTDYLPVIYKQIAEWMRETKGCLINTKSGLKTAPLLLFLKESREKTLIIVPKTLHEQLQHEITEAGRVAATPKVYLKEHKLTRAGIHTLPEIDVILISPHHLERLFAREELPSGLDFLTKREGLDLVVIFEPERMSTQQQLGAVLVASFARRFFILSSCYPMIGRLDLNLKSGTSLTFDLGNWKK